MRVLIIDSGNMISDNATGITLRNIWRGFDGEIDYLNTGFDAVTDYKQLFNQCYEVDMPYLRRCVHSRRKSRSGGKRSDTISVASFSKNMSITEKVIRTLKLTMHLLLPKVNAMLKRKLSNRRYDVLYVTGGDLGTLKIACDIQKATGSRVVLHFMDNYIDTIYGNSYIGKKIRHALNNCIDKLVEHSYSIICISDAMCDAYEKRYDRKTFCVLNTIGIEDSDPFSAGEDMYGYAGSCKIGRQNVLNVFLNALDKREIEKISKDGEGKRIKVNIYSGDFLMEREYSNIDITIKEIRNRNILFEELKKCKYLIYCESFEDSMIEFTKMSFSTKIPEYLAMRKPIICLAPKENAVARFIQANKLGFVCNDLSGIDVFIDLIGHISDEHLLSISEHEWAIYQEHFSPDVMKKNLKEAIEYINAC